MGRIRVGINGFGRIGRVLFRAGFDRMDIVGVNDLSEPDEAAHLLKFDSTHGIFQHEVLSDGNHLIVNGKKIGFSREKDPTKIPWRDWEVDLVLECTGVLKNKEQFEQHISAGAKKVLVSAPAKGVDLTIVYGVNHTKYDPAKHKTVSNASCTTNCLAPVALVLNREFGIENALMTTVHSYTNDQRLLDSSHKDLRRARAAAMSMIPTTTGAAKTVGEILPELKGKIDGVAIRVPTPNVSIVDLSFNTKKDLSVEAINQCLRKAAQEDLKGVLAVEDRQLVSVDYNGNSASSTVDSSLTMAMGPKLGKVFSWYDNEFGFSHRMVDFALYMQQKGM